MISLNRTARAGAAAFAALAVAAPIAQARPAALTAKQREIGLGAPVNQPHPANASHRNELVLGSLAPQPQPRTIVRVVHSDGSGFDFTYAAIGAASAMGVILVAGAVTTARRRRIALP